MKHHVTLFCMAGLFALPGHAANCAALDAEASRQSTRIPGDASGHDVIGTGRLQFYAAPYQGCEMAGGFIIPGDRVTAYSEYAGYTSVLYLNRKTGIDVMGWVKTARLKMNGTGIAPKQ